MIKSELISRIAEQNPHLFDKDVEKIVNAIFDEIGVALARRDRVELRGFGAFSVKTWSARPGRNPRTGAAISVPETHHPLFRTGKEMRERLNRAHVHLIFCNKRPEGISQTTISDGSSAWCRPPTASSSPSGLNFINPTPLKGRSRSGRIPGVHRNTPVPWSFLKAAAS